jgi:hypothetical protein
MASEEFSLLDCEFCDDVIDLSDQELPELKLGHVRLSTLATHR